MTYGVNGKGSFTIGEAKRRASSIFTQSGVIVAITENTMNPSETFFAAYATTLDARIEAHPDDFFGRWGLDLNNKVHRAEYIATTFPKMKAAILTGNYCMSPAIEAACRKVGIKPTKRALKAYLGGV